MNKVKDAFETLREYGIHCMIELKVTKSESVRKWVKLETDEDATLYAASRTEYLSKLGDKVTVHRTFF